MSGARKYVSMGLVLLVCTLTGHCGEGAPSAAAQSSSSSSRDAQSDWRRMVEIMRHAENAHGRHGSRTDAPTTSRARGSTAEPRNQRTEKSVGELGVSFVCWVLQPVESAMKPFETHGTRQSGNNFTGCALKTFKSLTQSFRK